MKRTLLLMLLMASPALAQAASGQAQVQVTVKDDQGALKPHVPVFIYEGPKIRKVVEGGDDGVATVGLPPGDYQISSSMSQKEGESISRASSYEASVTLAPGDHLSLILTLHPVQTDVETPTLSQLKNMVAYFEQHKDLN